MEVSSKLTSSTYLLPGKYEHFYIFCELLINTIKDIISLPLAYSTRFGVSASANLPQTLR